MRSGAVINVDNMTASTLPNLELMARIFPGGMKPAAVGQNAMNAELMQRAFGESDSFVTPFLPRICSRTLLGCFDPSTLRRAPEAIHQ